MKVAESSKSGMDGGAADAPVGLLRGDPRYRRVRLSGRGLTGRASYWLGPDHLLVVQVDHFVETYRRFFYREIRAMMICRTRAWEWGMGCGLLLFMLFAFVALAQLGGDAGSVSGERMGVLVMFGVLGVSVLLGTVLHGVLGRTVSLVIHTGVQSRRLAGIHRLRQAERLMAALESRILAAQAPAGGWTEGPGDLGGNLQEAAGVELPGRGADRSGEAL